MGVFTKMRNVFATPTNNAEDENERIWEEQRQARIKTLLCERKMLLTDLEKMWERKGVKRQVKQEIINMIVHNLEELRTLGHELTEEEMLVPELPSLEEERQAAAANKSSESNSKDNTKQTEVRDINVLDLNINEIDDRPGIPMTSSKPKKTSYDIVSLPSGGQCYKCKKENIAVAYLTAADENIIASPTLYKDGKIIDQLLYNNVVDEDFNVDDLCIGDADAIILWLRATGYGYDFPITVDDPVTGKEIKTSVNLQDIKTRPFNLIGDENGWFDFHLPISGDDIKFKFMTRAMDRRILRAELIENQALNRRRMQSCLEDIAEILAASKLNDSMPESEKQAVLEGIKKWDKSLDEEAQVNYTKLITNKMEVVIMSINGNEDRNFIHDYVTNMASRDSYEFRKFYNENEPGLDFEVTIQRPVDEQGLGGGSFTTFLPFDYTLFFTIGEL